MWSAVISSPSEVGGEIPSTRLRGLFLQLAGVASVIQHTSQLEMREHFVISFWFGIIGSLCPNYAGLLVYSERVSLRIGFGQRSFSDQCRVVVDETFREQVAAGLAWFPSLLCLAQGFPWAGSCLISGVAFC